jgi:hypothetical protein
VAEELAADPLNIPLDGWLPFRTGWANGAMAVDWCYLGRRRFVAPFFYQTIAQAMAEPFNLAFQQRTSIERLSELAPGLPVAGLIFHMSRCGSTLLAQALASLRENIVVSEAPPLHAILRAPQFGPATPEAIAAWLQNLVNAFAQPRYPFEKRLIIKFTATAAFDLPLILGAFPEVPWLFLYRDPLQILASHQVSAGAEFMPGSFAPQHLGRCDPSALDEDSYRAHCLAALGRAALAAARKNRRGIILNYRELSGALLDKLPQHFGLSLTETDRAAVLLRTRGHSKNAATPYVEDVEKSAGIVHRRKVVEAIVAPTIAALEARSG